MRGTRRKFGTALTLVALAFSTAAIGQALSPREIMERVDDYQRSISDSAFNRIRLSSCKFGIKDGKITCAERPRIKALESVGKNYGSSNKDTKNVTIVLEPAAERGIGMLTYVYEEANRDNETWLYLSALGRVKRIASSNSDDDSEAASLFGSEFTTEDTETGKLDEYSISLLEETSEGGREVWKLELVPNEGRARESRYSKLIHYVDKERFVSLRIEMYDQYDKEIKRLMASRVELINGAWTARSQTMMNLVSNRLSNMAVVEINTGLEIKDDFLTQRTLEDVAFRETELARLRSQVQ